MAQKIDLSGNDLVIGTVYAGASTPGGAGTALTGSELTVLDGVTAGTVTASKAVVVDANKDIATFRNVTLSGNLVSGATTISEAELGTIDGVVAGTIAASKAVVVDANKDAADFRNVGATGTATLAAVTSTGLHTTRSATATPAAASAVSALSFGSANVGIYWGTGDPNGALTAAQGSLFLRTDGSSGSTRAYVNTNGTTGWTNVTTAA